MRHNSVTHEKLCVRLQAGSHEKPCRKRCPGIRNTTCARHYLLDEASETLEIGARDAAHMTLAEFERDAFCRHWPGACRTPIARCWPLASETPHERQ